MGNRHVINSAMSRLLATIWLDCVVIIYIVLAFDRKVSTPVSQWVGRIFH